MRRQCDTTYAEQGIQASLPARRLTEVLPHMLLLAGLFLAGWFPVSVVHAQGTVDVISSTGRLVTDQADLLTSSEEQRLTAKLTAYEDTTSTQIVVVTIPSLEGVPAAEYALALGRSWGVGQAGQDNGVVILVARDDREVRIETGYGLEGAIPDAVAARIYRNVMVPYFREGRFYEGISGAADLLIAAAAGEFTAEEAAPRRAGRPPIDPSALMGLFILVWFIVSSIRRHRGGNDGGKRYRRHGYGPHFIIWGGGLGGGGGGFGGGLGGGGLGGGFGGFGGGGFGGGGAGGGW